MSLSKRNLCYSILISLVLVALMAGYFTFMLPSLYADYVRKDNIESVIQMHRGFVKQGSYNNLEVKNPTSCLSIVLPLEGSEIQIIGKFYQLTVDIREEELLQILNDFRSILRKWQEGEEIEWEMPEDAALWQTNETFSEALDRVFQEMQAEDAPVEIQFSIPKQGELIYNNAQSRMHVVEEGFLVLENTVEDALNQYTTYLAVEQSQNGFVFTVLPAMTPKMDEITPIVFGSLPMIGSVVILLVLLLSQLYSKGIVAPIIRLSNYVQNAKNSRIDTIQPLSNQRKDEIGLLTDELNEMYLKLKNSYLELESKNSILAEENKRQEVFLRASSHQLKTPVTAALLLVEGMMDKVGKYADTDAYLPQVKAQLLNLRKMVEDILALNRDIENIPLQEVSIEEVFEEVLGRFRIQIEEKKLIVVKVGEGGMVSTRKELLERIMDNLISNAVNYSPAGEKVEVRFSKEALEIQNGGCRIPEELLPHIFEPFVSSERTEKGRGLGLYAAAYDAKLLGFLVEIHNQEKGVTARLQFDRNPL